MKFVDADDYASFINRSAIIIRVRQPFIDWANSLDDGPKASLETYSPTLMLVNEIESDAEWDDLEDEIWDDAFSHQLAYWHRDPSDWPEPRSVEMFRTWFDVELHLSVCDSSIDPLFEH